MKLEIAQAVEFLGRLLQPKMESDLLLVYKQHLSLSLHQRFQDHWDTLQPLRGNAYRAISNFNGHLDPVLILAATSAAITPELIHTHLPRDFVLWIDPFSVAYRVGDHGNIMTLFEDRSRGRLGVKAEPPLTFVPRVSTPVRISPPNSPNSKQEATEAATTAVITAAAVKKYSIHQSSPLAIHAKKDEQKQLVMVN